MPQAPLTGDLGAPFAVDLRALLGVPTRLSPRGNESGRFAQNDGALLLVGESQKQIPRCDAPHREAVENPKRRVSARNDTWM